MTPRVTLDWSETLSRKSSNDAVHADLGIDQDMRRIAQNFCAPAFDRHRAVHEAIAIGNGLLGCGVMPDSGVIAEDLEFSAIELSDPTPGRGLPDRMPEEKST